MPRACDASTALAGAAFGIDERAQIVETVGGDHSGRDQFPQRSFDFSFQFAGAADDVGEERSAALAQKFQYLPRAVAQAAGFRLVASRIVRASSSRLLRGRRR